MNPKRRLIFLKYFRSQLVPSSRERTFKMTKSNDESHAFISRVGGRTNEKGIYEKNRHFLEVIGRISSNGISERDC